MIPGKKLAEKTGLHFSMISRIETGKANVSVDSLFKLAKALDIDIEDLFKF